MKRSFQNHLSGDFYDLEPFAHFKKREKHPLRGYNLVKHLVNEKNIHLVKLHSSKGVFHVFKVVQIVPNRAKCHKWAKAFKNGPSKICGQTISLQIFKGCIPQILLGPFLNTLAHLKTLKPF